MIGYKLNNAVGKTDPVPSYSPLITFDYQFDCPIKPWLENKLVISVHAISKEGYSYKFSEAIVEIPEVTNDDVYVHAICESSIGIFDVELDFALCNDNDPDKDQENFFLHLRSILK